MKSAREPWADQGESSSTHRPCARCGFIRRTNARRGVLCRDCIYTLSTSERKMWVA